MALLRCDVHSDVLGTSTSVTVILPRALTADRWPPAGGVPPRFPTLYLLHGLLDDDTAWVRNTSLERYVADLELAVVMPQASRSYYADEAHGGRYWTFLSEELPRVAGSYFPLSDRREGTFVAGLSMGGYGAVKWALRQPWRFRAAASLSGRLDLAATQTAGQLPDVMHRAFDDRPVAGTDNDLMWLVQEAARSGDLPDLYVACGTQDELLGQNHAFIDAARRVGLPVTERFSPGNHEWGYWDRAIQDVLAWLPGR